jgi:hypothetical protein
MKIVIDTNAAPIMSYEGAEPVASLITIHVEDCDSAQDAIDLEQLTVFVDAWRIFRNRSARHGEGWKNSGWRGALFDMHKKMDRLWNEFMLSKSPPSDYDSALDLMNFAAFFIRGRRDGLTGRWQWPE